MAYNLDAKVPAGFAARRLGVSRQLIRRWCQLGHLHPVGQDGRSPLYRWGDLVTLELAMRENPRSSRYQPA